METSQAAVPVLRQAIPVLRAAAAALIVASLVVAASCAPRVSPPPVVTPAFPDFVFPVVPPGLGNPRAVELHQRAWRFLQARDLANAEREFSGALSRARGFYPAEAGLGYVNLARRDFDAALQHFNRGLAVESRYVPALVGQGEALLGLDRTGEAMASFETALEADPSLSFLRERVQVLALRSVQENLAAARTAVEEGRFDEARAAYQRAIAGSPESAFLYRDLAAVEQKQGRYDEALAHLEKAVALDPEDGAAWAQTGELYEARGEFDKAGDAYAKAASIDPSGGMSERAEAMRTRAAVARLPEEYRAIPSAPRLTRGELAALIGVRFADVFAAAASRPAVVVDARGHWALPWILLAVRSGSMEVYPNHTFQPGGFVTRGNLAETLTKILDLIASRRPNMPRPWENARPAIADLPPRHLGYPAAAVAVSAGLMTLTDEGHFQPSRVVSGAEAVDAVGRLEALARAWAPAGHPEVPAP